MPFIDTIYQTIQLNELIHPDDHIIVAVSGGPDSVALLHVLHQLTEQKKLNCRLTVAHVNHQFRGEESDAEEYFSRQLANQLGLTFLSKRIDIPSFMKESGLGAQEAARLKRYAFLKQSAEQLNANKVALAHHADDQVETVLHRLLRGTGLQGLSGMSMLRHEGSVSYIRPFLQVTKAAILHFLETQQYDYRIDSSNLETKYARNKLRQHVIPLLESIQPDFGTSILRLSEIAGTEDDYIQQQSRVWFEAHVEQFPDRCRFELKLWRGLHLALQRRMIKLILSYLSGGLSDIDYTRIGLVREALLSSKSNLSLHLGGGLMLLKEYGRAQVIRQDHYIITENVSYRYALEPEHRTLSIPEIEAEFRAMILDSGDAKHSIGASEAWFDAAELEWPLYVRNRMNGDRIESLGLKGSKKVKDIFIDVKMAPSLRQLHPIVTDRLGRILWIPGVKRSRHALIQDSTTQVLHIQWVNRET